jgi:ABC-type glycerol-3-phosphate transport system permease component
MKVTAKSAIGYGARQLLLLLMAVVTCYPIYYIFSNALKSRAAYADSPLSLPPTLVFTNFSQIFATPNFLRWFYNSLVLTSITVVLCLFIGALASYALSKMYFPGKKLLINFSIALMVIPTIVMIIPLFVLMVRICDHHLHRHVSTFRHVPSAQFLCDYSSTPN